MQQSTGVPATPSDVADTLSERVRRAARERPEHPALVWHDRSISWRELDARIDRVAPALLGSVPVDAAGRAKRVAIALPNCPDFAVAFFAVLRAGLVAVPVNPGFTAREMRYVLRDSGAAMMICTEAVRAELAAVRDELPDLTDVHVTLPEVDHPPATGTVRPAGPGEVAVLLYTSGTEGEPKGAMLSHRALMANHEQLACITPPVVGPDDVLLLSLPLSHAYGLNSGLGAVAYHAATGVLVERFDPADALDLIARHHVTAVLGVPSMYVGWALLADGGTAVGEAMASVRVAVCGAAPLDPTTAGRFAEATRHPVFVGYGLTETAPVLTSTLLSPVPKAGSIGRPIPGVGLRLVTADGYVAWEDAATATATATAATATAADDPDEFDLDLTGGGSDPGQIVVRGANLFSGYWPDGNGGPDAEGWWATGDIAYADDDGDLFLVDRLGEVILVSGFNVYPREVEQVLSAHPDIAEAAAVGIPHPYTGQTVKAYLVRSGGSQVTAEEVLQHCERNLARFKCPTAVEFVDQLPHSTIGKVRKTLLRSEGGHA